LLKSATSSTTGIYLTARLHSRTYLLHPRDILTIPTLKPLQAPGTTLSLTRILEVGSRDHSIRSPAAEGKTLRKTMEKGMESTLESLPPWVVSCELTVLEHTKSPMERTILKKRRKGYKKTIENKQGWTRLRVGDIVLGDGVPL
ncbi:large subunit ribosomal protein L21, partial [Tremellales sp. Uapishka_1]